MNRSFLPVIAAGLICGWATVVMAAAPSITGLSTHSAAPGESVTIYGSNFGHTGGYVVLSGLRVTATAWSATQITFVVPTDGCSGRLAVRQSGGAISNSVWFVVKRTLPAGQIEPANLRLADTGLPGAAFLIETDGAYFYGISGFETLSTFRIRASGRPELRSRMYLPQRVGDLRLNNGYLFCSGDHGLSVFRCSDLQTRAADPVAAVYVGPCMALDVRDKTGSPFTGTLVALCEYLPRAGTNLLCVDFYRFSNGELIRLGTYSRPGVADERQQAIAIDPLNPKVYVSGAKSLLGSDKYILELDVTDPSSPTLHFRQETGSVLACDMDARGTRLWAGLSLTGTALFRAYELKPNPEHLTTGPTVVGSLQLGRVTRIRIVDDNVTVGGAWWGARPDVFVLETFGYGTAPAASANSLDWAFDVTGFAEGTARGKILVADEWGGFITYNYQRPSGYTLTHATDYQWAMAAAMTEGIYLTADRLYVAGRGAGVWSADRFNLANDAQWRFVPWQWGQATPQPHPISALRTRRDPVRGTLIAALGHNKAMAWGEKIYGLLYQETDTSIVLLAFSEEIDPPGAGSEGVSVLWPEPDLVYMITGTDGFRAFVVNPDAPSIRLHKDCLTQGFAANIFSASNIAICMGGCTVGGQYKILIGSQPALLVSSPTLHVFNATYPQGIPNRANPDRPIVITRESALACTDFNAISHLDVRPSGLVAAATQQGVILFHISWIPALNALTNTQAWNKILIPTGDYQPWWHSSYANSFHDVAFGDDRTLYVVKTPEGVWQLAVTLDWGNYTHTCKAAGYYPGFVGGINNTPMTQGWGNPDIVTLHHPYGLAADGDGTVYVTGWSGKVQRLVPPQTAARESWAVYY
ncbi:MAG: IPT/TIG domain-containing protein [Candidatus Sumerlaeia bacterium]|nr:IPT/TIG domain-containing protein [Candidatus Sumerlaeia bacterium]